MASNSANFSVNLFEKGKMTQVENAKACAEKGKPCLGMKIPVQAGIEAGCVLLADVTRKSELEPVMPKIHKINKFVGIGSSGFSADFEFIARKMQKSAVAYERSYDQPAPVEFVVMQLADLMQEYTQRGGVRPFGVTLLVIGKGKKEWSLWKVDPSGATSAWKAHAIGKEWRTANGDMEKRYQADMRVDDAISVCLHAIKPGMESLKKECLQIMKGTEEGVKLLSEEEIGEYIEDLS